MLPGEGLPWQVCEDALHPAGSPEGFLIARAMRATNPSGVGLYLRRAAEGNHQNKPSSLILFVCLCIIKSAAALPPPFVWLPPTSTQRERAADFNTQQYSGSVAPAHTAQSVDGAPGKFSV